MKHQKKLDFVRGRQSRRCAQRSSPMPKRPPLCAVHNGLPPFCHTAQRRQLRRTPVCSIIELNIFLTILVYPRRHDREIFRTDHKATFGQSAAYAHVHRHSFRLRAGGRQHPCLRSERCAGRNALFCRRRTADAGHHTADQPAVLRHAAAGAGGQTDEQRHDRSR